MFDVHSRFCWINLVNKNKHTYTHKHRPKNQESKTDHEVKNQNGWLKNSRRICVLSVCYPFAIPSLCYSCHPRWVFTSDFFHTFCGDNVEVKSIAEPRLGGLDVRWLGGLAPRQGEGLPPTNEGVLSRGGGEYWRMDG